MTYQVIKKNLILLISLLILLFCKSIDVYAADATGICGDEITWSLSDGHLVLEGTGDMMDYSEKEFAPWNEIRNEIQSIAISEGITGIGELAFYHCENLENVTFPDSLLTIGDYAFAGCKSLKQVLFGNALKSIGQSAFDSCESLVNVRLPESLITLKEKAFYRCSSLGGITIPYNTTDLGVNVFGYCYSLAYVQILAPIKELPYWSFYGCTLLDELWLPDTVETIQENAMAECPELSYVNYGGSEVVRAEMEQMLKEPAIVVNNPSINREVEYKVSENSMITITHTQQNIVDKAGNSVPADIEVNAVVNNPSGWKDIVDVAVKQADSNTETPIVNVQILDTQTLEKETLADLSGKNIQFNIITDQNIIWQVNMADQSDEKLREIQELSVSLKRMEEAEDWQKEVIGDAVCYTVQFAQTSFNTAVILPLDISWARSTATLYKVNGKMLQLIQSVVVDNVGKAAFSLAGTEKGEYLLALNVVGIKQSESMIPEALLEAYAMADGATLMDSKGNLYKITRRESDWGININQVTWIMIAVISISAFVIGIIMYVLNKKKFAMGYMSEIED